METEEYEVINDMFTDIKEQKALLNINKRHFIENVESYLLNAMHEYNDNSNVIVFNNAIVNDKNPLKGWRILHIKRDKNNSFYVHCNSDRDFTKSKNIELSHINNNTLLSIVKCVHDNKFYLVEI